MNHYRKCGNCEKQFHEKDLMTIKRTNEDCKTEYDFLTCLSCYENAMIDFTDFDF